MDPAIFNPRVWVVAALTAVLTACGSGDEYDGFDASVDASTPNKFLTFFNRQADLAAGSYTLVVATAAANQSGDCSVTIERKNRAAQLITGSWSDSGGPDSDPSCASGNRCYQIALDDASGASFRLSSEVDSLLYLVDDSDTPKVVASANDGGAGAAESLYFSESEIDEDDLTNAYYAAVDPGNARTTAQDYVAIHGIDDPLVHVIFRDSKDLGYGRDMYMNVYTNESVGSTCGPPGAVTIAWYVRNFSVKIVDGFAYGPINLEAAIGEDLQHHVGTNAIEFGYGRSDLGDTCAPDDQPMAKFYTFEPDYSTPGAPHPRRTRVDLDARGAKAMPQPCISCHGGKLRPLDRFGRFVAMHANDRHDPVSYPPAAGEISSIGDTKARMQAFEVDTFEFSDQPGHTRADYEEGLRLLNLAVYCTYPDSQADGDAVEQDCSAFGGGVAEQTDIGEWSGDFGRDMLIGWYGGALDTAGGKYSGEYIPDGWKPSIIDGTPAGADTLFKKVVGPNCFVCHGKRGTELGSNLNADGEGKDLDFSSWEKFISHADEIERLVYDEGRMPLGLLNFQNFWNDPEKAELLASFIAPYVSDPTGFQARRVDADGDIIEPGERIVARAGPDRVTKINAPITLNAQASLFADSYSWQVISTPALASATLSSASGKRVSFSADTEGQYELRLTARSSQSGASRSDTLLVEVDDGPAPRELAFYNDLSPQLAISTRLATCAGACHSDGAQAGVPVWWVDDDLQPLATPADASAPPSLGFYEQVMARVNLEYVEDSLILKKPSGIHHFGNQRIGFDTSLALGSAGRADYDMFVNWIAEGAICGVDDARCPDTD